MPNLTNSQTTDPPVISDNVIRAAMRGDAAALASIYDCYARRIYRYFYSRVEDAVEADDLTAQTFLKVIEALPRYQHYGHFTAWIFQIARNIGLSHFRRGQEKSLDEDQLALLAIDNNLDDIINQQALQTLRIQVRTLDEEERELLRLRFVVDLTYAEIARLLNRKEDTVRKAVNRILERLYLQMEPKNA